MSGHVPLHQSISSVSVTALISSPRLGWGMPTTATMLTAGVSQDHLFEFARVDLEPTTDDHVLRPVDEVVIAIFVAAADVTVRNQPARITSSVSSGRPR